MGKGFKKFAGFPLMPGVVVKNDLFPEHEIHFEKLISQKENSFCIGRPVLVNDVFKEQWRLNSTKYWNHPQNFTRDEWSMLWDSIKVPELNDINSIEIFRTLLNREFDKPSLRVGDMYKCIKETLCFKQEQMKGLEEDIKNQFYPYPFGGILEGTHCMFLKANWFLFKVIPRGSNKVPCNYYEEEENLRYGGLPVPKVYAVRKFEFLCFHPEIAKRHNKPPKHLDPKSFRAEEPHIRIVFSEPVQRSYGPSLICRNFEPLWNNQNQSNG